jgi:phosphatidylglycerophosphate synthase
VARGLTSRSPHRAVSDIVGAVPSNAKLPPAARRPLATRDAGWARALARGLASAGVRPNAISFASLVFAGIGSWAFWRLGSADGGAHVALAMAAAVAIQLRLLMNLLDGLVAVEHDRKEATGDLWNEVPDRIADVSLLLGAGCGLPAGAWPGSDLPLGLLLGGGAALAAMATAYVRQLGGALGFPQDFRGPLAKQHRMFVLTLGALASTVDGRWAVPPGGALAVALAVIVIGSLFTCGRRLRGIARALRSRAAAS